MSTSKIVISQGIMPIAKPSFQASRFSKEASATITDADNCMSCHNTHDNDNLIRDTSHNNNHSTISFEFEGWQTDGVELDDELTMSEVSTFDGGDNNNDNDDNDDIGVSNIATLQNGPYSGDQEDETELEDSGFSDEDETTVHHVMTEETIIRHYQGTTVSSYSDDSQYLKDHIDEINVLKESIKQFFPTCYQFQPSFSVDDASATNSEKDYSDANYESESSCTSFADSHDVSRVPSCTKLALKPASRNHNKLAAHKKVRFGSQDSVIGFSELDETEVPNQKTLHELCMERRMLKKTKEDDSYSLFDSDPEFQELEQLTKKLTRLNESLSKLNI